MTPCGGNNFLFSSSQQLPCLSPTVKMFFEWASTSSHALPLELQRNKDMCCATHGDPRTPSRISIANNDCVTVRWFKKHFFLLFQIYFEGRPGLLCPRWYQIRRELCLIIIISLQVKNDGVGLTMMVKSGIKNLAGAAGLVRVPLLLLWCLKVV